MVIEAAFRTARTHARQIINNRRLPKKRLEFGRKLLLGVPCVEPARRNYQRSAEKLLPHVAWATPESPGKIVPSADCVRHKSLKNVGGAGEKWSLPPPFEEPEVGDPQSVGSR